MTILRLLVFFIVVLGSGVSLSCAGRKDAVRAQDRVDIEQLMWNYIRALDSGNAEAYAALFAPNGKFVAGTTAIKGREALKKMISDARKQIDAANTGEKSRHECTTLRRTLTSSSSTTIMLATTLTG